MVNEIGLGPMMELIKLKKEKPEEYKQLLEDFMGISLDLAKVAKKLVEKMDE